MSALHVAVRCGYQETVDLLLRHEDINVNIQTNVSITIL